jgi:trimethylamine:corrinoid methyltransferase-like protein
MPAAMPAAPLTPPREREGQHDMGTWHPRIGLPLSPSDLAAVLDDALRVLAEIGIGCASHVVSSLLLAWPGASRAGGRLRFAAGPVLEHLERRRAALAASGDDPDERFSLGGCWAGLFYCDPDTQRVRPATSQEAARMARLWDARGLSGVVPLQPGDVPPELVTLTAERIALTNSRHLGGSLPVTDAEEVRFLIDMNLAAGRRYRLVEQVAISPLRLNGAGVEVALRFRDAPDVDVHLAGAIPIAGATCPLDPRAALVQAVAEALAFDIISVALGFAGGLSLRVEPFDFQYSGIVFGSPEWCLYRALVLRMTEYLTGRTPRSGMFRSCAKQPDEQAACERTACALWQALLGVRHFGAVGQLSVDEVFSPQQAVLDREILAYVERVIGGLDLEPGADDAVALIRSGVEDGGFMGLADTASRFRAFYCFPDVFRHWNVGRWRAEGAPSVLGEAWARARDEIAASTFALPAEQEREVDAIFERATRSVRRRATAAPGSRARHPGA